VYTRQRLCHVNIRWQAGEPDLTPIKTMPNEVVDNIKTLLLGSPVDTPGHIGLACKVSQRVTRVCRQLIDALRGVRPVTTVVRSVL
jgi:hypothetical protein